MMMMMMLMMMMKVVGVSKDDNAVGLTSILDR